jgi:NADH-quinone oxidoreductase subunit L
MTFAIGGLALAGNVPLAGFWSKDEILSALLHARNVSNSSGDSVLAVVYTTIYWVAVVTAFLTAFYTGRAFFWTFWGPEKLPSPDDPEADPSEHGGHDVHGVATATAPATAELARYEDALGTAATADHAHYVPPPDDHSHADHIGHESPPIMWVPLVVLAVCAGLVGLILGPTGWFEHHVVAHTPALARLAHAHYGFDLLTAVVGTVAGLGGLALSWWFYAAPSGIPARLAQWLKPLYEASYAKFHVDEIYQALVVAPTRFLATISKYFDIYVIDGLVRLAAWIPRLVGRDILGPFQNGLIQFYAATTALGVTFLLIVLIFWRS